jgi:NADH-quinone oxidoreductase subunit G
MAKISIDGKEYLVEDGITIIQACEAAGVQIPRFCYHEKLAIAGNCRMCLVEVEKAPKPVASCSISVTEGMIIKTESAMVKKAREGVMEFLLINHPLDCPICDQGGECDLQDQAFKYGNCKSDYKEDKRAVDDQYMGPLIATNMTRCIHCTRCVRFLEDIAGTNELGAIGRGENMAISTYIASSITSELSGNIIDLCPVGALTSKPYAFTARSWELSHTYSVDVMDGVGSHIRIDTRGNEVMRILPQAYEEINEEWISDRTRFSYDGLKYQRLDSALIRHNKSLSPVDYKIAIEEAARVIQGGQNLGVILGKLSDVETMFAAKGLVQKFGSGYIDFEVDLHGLSGKSRGDYIFNSKIIGVEEADHLLLINTNPRYEAAVINGRIRKSVIHNQLKVGFIGAPVNLNYDHEPLGEDVVKILKELLSGEHPYCNVLSSTKKPMMIIGSGVSKDLLNLCKRVAQKYNFISPEWNGFNVLHHAAGAVGALDIGCVKYSVQQKKNLSECDTVVIFGADDIDMNALHNKKVIYIGHHGDKAVYSSDIIIPSPAFTEKSGTYVNTEGRVQRTTQAVKQLGAAHPEYQIVLDLAKKLGFTMPFADISSLRRCMTKANKVFSDVNLWGVMPSEVDLELSETVKVKTSKFQYPISNFYMTDAISRSSRIMAECSRVSINKI